MDVGQTAKQLVHVDLRRGQRCSKGQEDNRYDLHHKTKPDGTHLHIYDRNDALGLVKMPGDPVNCLRDKVQNQVEVHFILLHSTQRQSVALKHVG